MSPTIIGFIGFVVFFALLAIGMPVAVAFALVGFGGFWYLVSGTASIAQLAIISFNTVSDYSLAVLPLFLLMAHVFFASGVTRDLYNTVNKWLGHQPGGLAMASLGASAIFAAVSASSLATATTIGLTAIPEMRRYNYHPALATGVIAAGGTMGILIPPSGILIIYGIITGTSIGKLFIAGIIPGIIEGVTYITLIYFLCRWKPQLGPRGPSSSFREKIAALSGVTDVALLIFLVLGGLIVGWFTPTEAGAVGAFGAICISLFRRRLTWLKFKQAIMETLKTTGMLYLILIGAFMFNSFMAVTTLPFWLSDFVAGLPLPPLAIMGFLVLVYLFLGAIMDMAAIILLTIPIFFPLVVGLGFDPIWFGVFIVMVTEVAMITPPIGINVYALSGIVPDVPMETIFKGIVPFLMVDICRVALLLFVPAIALFLPSLMG